MQHPNHCIILFITDLDYHTLFILLSIINLLSFALKIILNYLKKAMFEVHIKFKFFKLFTKNNNISNTLSNCICIIIKSYSRFESFSIIHSHT